MLVWIEGAYAVAGIIGALLTTVGTCAIAVRWVVRREMQPIRGEVAALSDRVETWIGEHQRRHEDEQAAIASAFERSGMYPPDGWGHRRVPRADAGEGQQQ